MWRVSLSVLLMAMLAGCAPTPSKPRYVESAPAANSQCLKSGTRIEPKKSECVQPGRSSGDLTRAHQTTAAGAIRQADPSITIRQ
jgi:hypothetical protein